MTSQEKQYFYEWLIEVSDLFKQLGESFDGMASCLDLEEEK